MSSQTRLPSACYHTDTPHRVRKNKQGKKKKETGPSSIRTSIHPSIYTLAHDPASSSTNARLRLSATLVFPEPRADGSRRKKQGMTRKQYNETQPGNASIAMCVKPSKSQHTRAQQPLAYRDMASVQIHIIHAHIHKAAPLTRQPFDEP